MVELKLTEQQLQTLVGLLDAGVRSSGLQAVPGAAELLGLIDASVKEAQAKQQQVSDIQPVAETPVVAEEPVAEEPVVSEEPVVDPVTEEPVANTV